MNFDIARRLEKAHEIVGKGEMPRQKKYHDANVSWSLIKPGDMVLVYVLFTV